MRNLTKSVLSVSVNRANFFANIYSCDTKDLMQSFHPVMFSCFESNLHRLTNEMRAQWGDAQSENEIALRPSSLPKEFTQFLAAAFFPDTKVNVMEGTICTAHKNNINLAEKILTCLYCMSTYSSIGMKDLFLKIHREYWFLYSDCDEAIFCMFSYWLLRIDKS